MCWSSSRKCRNFFTRNWVMEYILRNFMLYVRGNFNNVTIYIWQYIHILHWYSVCGAFQLRVKKFLHLREELQHMTIVRFFFTYVNLSYIYNRRYMSLSYFYNRPYVSLSYIYNSCDFPLKPRQRYLRKSYKIIYTYVRTFTPSCCYITCDLD
jgi:hypothetical protein